MATIKVKVAVIFTSVISYWNPAITSTSVPMSSSFDDAPATPDASMTALHKLGNFHLYRQFSNWKIDFRYCKFFPWSYFMA